MSKYTADDFSVITTVFNGAPYLPRYLSTTEALVNSTNAEIVIVDDGSNDESIALMEARAAENNAIKVVRAGRVGRASALNVAIAASERTFVAIQDVDDIALPDRLVRLAEAANAFPNATLYATGGVTINEDLLKSTSDFSAIVKRQNGTAAYRHFDASDIFNRNFLIHSATAFRVSDWNKAGGYNDKLKSCIDLDIYLRLLAHGNGVLDDNEAVIFSHNLKSFFRTRSKIDYRNDLFEVMRLARDRNSLRRKDVFLGYMRAFRYTSF